MARSPLIPWYRLAVRISLLLSLLLACDEPAPPSTAAAPGAPAAPGGPVPNAGPNGPGPNSPGQPVPNGPPPGNTGPVRSGAVDLDRPLANEKIEVDPTARCSGCDIVVITMCSMRRDHIGAYGEIAGLTPTLDRIAATGVRFNQAYAASNFTLSSLSALLTARFGSSTGVLGWTSGLPEGVSTLPEVLGIYGYRTGGFTIDAASGFRPDYHTDRGFQRMVVIPPPRDTPDGRFAEGPIGPGGASAAPVVKWLAEQDKSRPLFTMFHTRTAHYPFVISEDGADADPTGVYRALWQVGNIAQAGAMPGMAGGAQRSGLVASAPDQEMRVTRQAGAAGEAVWRQTYADAVRRTDQDIAAVMAALEARGKLDRTILVVLADHGEGLGDNGELLHGGAYFDNIVRVPLIVSVPGVTPGQRDTLVSQVDVMPTLLELVGVRPPAEIDGVSLVSVLDGGLSKVRSTALVEGGATNHTPTELQGAVVSPPWVMLRQGFPCTSEFLENEPAPPKPGEVPPPPAGAPGGLRTCLFNLEEDPDQKKDLAEAHPEVVAELRARWDGYRDGVAGRTVPRELQLDPAFVELLQRTGYDFRQDGAAKAP